MSAIVSGNSGAGRGAGAGAGHGAANGASPSSPMLRSSPSARSKVTTSTQMRAMLWKNYLLVKKYPKDLLRELGIPIIFLLALVLIKLSVHNTIVPLARDAPVKPVQGLAAATGGNQLFFAPCASQSMSDPVYAFMTTLVNATEGQLSTYCFECNVPTATCTGEASLQAYATGRADTVAGGVVFPQPHQLAARAAAGDAPPPVDYELRMDPTLMPGIGDSNVSVLTFGPISAAWDYYPTFVAIQQAVESHIIATVAHPASSVPAANVTVRQFPFPSYQLDIAALVLNNILPIYILLIFSLQVRVTLQKILEEKEKRIKAGMRMMGLSDFVFFGSWFITALVKGGILVTVVTIVLKVGNLFKYSNFFVILIYLLLFLFCCIAYTFVISALFDTSRTGGAVGMICYLVLFLPSIAVRTPSVPQAVQLAVSVVAPTGFSLGNSILLQAERGQVGIHFGNLFERSTFVGTSLGNIWLVLIGDAILYTFLAWYLDKVIPSEFGSTLPPCFCCTTRYWARRKRRVETPLLDIHANSSASVEAVAPELVGQEALVISGLCKTFNTSDGPKNAVDGLNLRMYEGHITCLLGHNGAGKTTTVSLLTGLFDATSGDATVYGRSIVDDMDGVRALCGVCPQHDILFDKLSVYEHLKLFAGIKGLPPARQEDEITNLIAEVGLQEKTHSEAASLSGGQKRRLSVAIALIGDPQVVFLDEPTSGLDPSARRQIWKLLEARKKGRVIVLTTHFMDEADILGDRIAIMAHGKLRVAGSSLYLKSRFGIGYHLTVAANQGFSTETVLARIRNFVPLAAIESESLAPGLSGTDAAGAGAGAGTDTGTDVGTAIGELSVVLPYAQVHRFAGLFTELDNHKDALCIDSYGVSVTTLEEVFVRLAREVQAEERLAKDLSDRGVDRKSLPRVNIQALGREASGRHISGELARAVIEQERNDSVSDVPINVSAAEPGNARFKTYKHLKPSVKRHIGATVRRLFTASKRDRRGLFLQIIMPTLFVGISFAFRGLSTIGALAPLLPIPMNPTQFSSVSPANAFMFAANSSNMPTVDAIMANLPSASLQSGMPDLAKFPSPSDGRVTFDDIDSYLLAHEDVQTVVTVMGPGVYNVMPNSSFVNDLPIAINLLNNARLFEAQGVKPDAHVYRPLSLTYSPLPRPPKENGASTGHYLANGLMGFYIALGYATIPALQAVRIVNERATKSKQMQFIMGMLPTSYWIGNWMWDYLQFLVPAFASVALLAAFGHDVFHGAKLAAAACMLLGWGVALPGLVYAWSFLFKNKASAQTFTLLLFYLATMLTFFASFILEFPTFNIPSIVGEILRYVFMLLPTYNIAKGLLDVGAAPTCEHVPAYVECVAPSPFGWNYAGQKLAYMALAVPLWLSIVLLIERKAQPRPANATAPRDLKAGEELEDTDVHKERARIDRGGTADDLVVKHLRKVFPSQNEATPEKVAVADLTLGCPSGQCLGLLGPNGAGKSTSLSMLTADLSPTYGTASLGGVDIFSNRTQCYARIGFCAQADALFDLLSGSECLRFYATVKGMADADIDEFVQESLERMDLTRYANVHTKTYSGGNKRKLSLCIAFTGAPQTIFLDEPSTGVDPEARRRMWDIILASRAGRTIVLTTHLMEEAQALCQRVAIMINGRLACIGTPQHLKSLYGNGYQLEVKTRNPTHARALHDIVVDIAPTATLTESHGGYLKYQLGVEASLATVFGTMEAHKDELEVEDYAMSQTSLEQVFLAFAKRQVDENASAGASAGTATTGAATVGGAQKA